MIVKLTVFKSHGCCSLCLNFVLIILGSSFQVSMNPTRILKQEAEEERGEIARLSSFVGAIAIGELVKSTLGPKGMDKILVGVGRNEGQVGEIYNKHSLSEIILSVKSGFFFFFNNP